MILLIYIPSFTNIQPLDETHLGVVRGLIYPRGFAQCVNKESSSQGPNYARLEQTDLYANAKSSVCRVADLYHISYFRETIYHIVFSPVAGVLEFRLWTWNMAFLEMEMKKLGRPTSTSQASCRRKKPLRWKSINTYTRTNMQGQFFQCFHMCIWLMLSIFL